MHRAAPGDERGGGRIQRWFCRRRDWRMTDIGTGTGASLKTTWRHLLRQSPRGFDQQGKTFKVHVIVNFIIHETSDHDRTRSIGEAE